MLCWRGQEKTTLELNPKKTEREDGQCSARSVPLFEKDAKPGTEHFVSLYALEQQRTCQPCSTWNKIVCFITYDCGIYCAILQPCESTLANFIICKNI